MIDTVSLSPSVIVLQSNPNIWECISVIAACCAGVGAIAAFVVSFITYRRSKAPDVVAYLQTNNDAGILGFVVRNIGNGCAYDIELQGFDNAIADSGLLAKIRETFIWNGIPMLAPAQQRDTALCKTSYALKHYTNKSCELIVSWKRKPKARRTFSAKFTIDYSSFANSLYVLGDMHLIKEDLDGINNTLHKMANKFFPSAFMSDDGIRTR